MNALQQGRRNFLRAGAALAGTGLLQACGNTSKPEVKTNSTPTPPVRRSGGNNSLRIFASSGYGESTSRCELGVARLSNAGFMVSNQQAYMRRSQRFAGSDIERTADFQDVANGRVSTPKVLMGVRGGYGAMRILPKIDWESLGRRMHEHGTMLYGYSDVTALQLALLAKGNMCSFAGPMLYSEFGKPQMNEFTIRSFIDNSCNPHMTVSVNYVQNYQIKVDGILWGGNLSVLSALAGSPFMPAISGGILFIEDVGEQPYRIERMLQTLYLSGVMNRQQAIVLGNFRMSGIRDVYDSSYTLNSVIQTMARLTKVPVLTGFPFGHITEKVTFPLGAKASLRSMSNGGYQISFSDYPTLNPADFNLNTLLPPPPVMDNILDGNTGLGNDTSVNDSGDDM